MIQYKLGFNTSHWEGEDIINWLKKIDDWFWDFSPDVNVAAMATRDMYELVTINIDEHSGMRLRVIIEPSRLKNEYTIEMPSKKCMFQGASNMGLLASLADDVLPEQGRTAFMDAVICKFYWNTQVNDCWMQKFQTKPWMARDTRALAYKDMIKSITVGVRTRKRVTKSERETQESRQKSIEYEANKKRFEHDLFYRTRRVLNWPTMVQSHLDQVRWPMTEYQNVAREPARYIDSPLKEEEEWMKKVPVLPEEYEHRLAELERQVAEVYQDARSWVLEQPGMLEWFKVEKD